METKDLYEWIVCLIDTGMGWSDLICSCIDETHTFYDHRVQEQYPDIDEKFLTKVIDEMLYDKGFLKCDDFYLKVNWKKWKEERGKIPSIDRM